MALNQILNSSQVVDYLIINETGDLGTGNRKKCDNLSRFFLKKRETNTVCCPCQAFVVIYLSSISRIVLWELIRFAIQFYLHHRSYPVFWINRWLQLLFAWDSRLSQESGLRFCFLVFLLLA